MNWLITIIALVVGAIAGFFIGVFYLRKQMMNMSMDNKQIQQMAKQMGMNVNQKQLNQMSKTMKTMQQKQSRKK